MYTSFVIQNTRTTRPSLLTSDCSCSCCSSRWWAWGCPKHVDMYLNDKQ